MPKVSVIIPTYNRAEYLSRTINSVLKQTFSDWELLIVDDGSADNTFDVVKEFTDKDERIKYFYQKNSGGPSSPRNTGLEKAQGEFIAFLDSDDEWFPEKLQKQIDFFTNNQNPKLGVLACFVYVKENKTGELTLKKDNYFKGNVINKLVNNNFLFTSSCVMTKLSILKEIGLFDLQFKVGEDWDIWLRISEAGYEFDFVPEYLVNYFVHDKNTYYGNKNFNGEQELIAFCTKHKELLIKNSSLILGYYYWLTKKYKLSRKYLLQILINKDSDRREKIKSLGCLIISVFPSLKTISQKIWTKIRILFQK